MKNLRTVVIGYNPEYFCSEPLWCDGFDKVPMDTAVVRILDCIKDTTDHYGDMQCAAMTANRLHQYVTQAVWTMWFYDDRANVVRCEYLAAMINSVCLENEVRFTQRSYIELAHTCIVFDDQQRSGAWRHGHTFVMIVC